MSKLKVNELDTKTGTTLTVTTGKTLDIPAGGTLTVAGTQTVTGTANLTGATLTLPATLPATALTNATNIPAAQLSGQVPTANLGNVDTSGLEADIALLAFKTQANGSLARYNLIDQSVDSFEDATGVDAGASTGENRSASNYYFGGTAGSAATISFTTPGATTWTTPQGLETLTHVLVVAGGGGGGGSYNDYTSGGGGGAGGLVYQANRAVVGSTTYNITVGTGGAGGAGGGNFGVNGTDSVFDTITAIGGGGGNAYGGPAASQTGGSGGGGARSGTAANRDGSDKAQADSGGGTGFGNVGGNGQPYSNNTNNASGGGGGAGGVGGNSNGGTQSGNGGAGKDYTSEFSNAIGDNGWFAGGAGGGANSTLGYGNGGNGNYGGGGNGGLGSGSHGVAGTANTGGGGGGAVTGAVGPANHSGGVGGSGAVHIKHGAYTAEGGNMTLVSNAQTAAAGAPTKGDLVMTISNGLGTTTVNTDVKAYISRDGSAYTNAVTLVSKGTTAGHTILTANDVDLSGIATGTSMRWKVETLNQNSASKTTRIQAVSLGWS